VENGIVLSFVACLEEKKLYEFRSLREYNGGTKASLPFFFFIFFWQYSSSLDSYFRLS